MPTPPAFTGRLSRSTRTPLYRVVWSGRGPLPSHEITGDLGWEHSGSFAAIRRADLAYLSGSWNAIPATRPKNGVPAWKKRSG